MISAVLIHEQLHQQIDDLPDDIVGKIADFMQFIMEKRDATPVYSDWKDRQWQDFALSQFLRETDDVGYSLEDAQEIYRP